MSLLSLARPLHRVSPLRSMIENLEGILNSYEGYSSLLPEVGLSYDTLDEAKDEVITAELKALVERREPRLAVHEVKAERVGARIVAGLLCHLLEDPSHVFWLELGKKTGSRLVPATELSDVQRSAAQRVAARISIQKLD
ncbi:MAG: hypothetical protein AAF355_12745 [Myxococcota bacterium]